jgi:hypothetical protein
MKKHFLEICASIGILALFGSSVIAQSSWLPPVKTMVIPFAKGPVTLDGDAFEDFYSDEQSTTIFDPLSDAGIPGSTDLTGVFKVCYDYNFLYVQANITDWAEGGVGNDGNNCWTDMNPDNSWHYDNSEIYFDLDTNGADFSNSPTAYDSTCVELRINRGRDSLMTVSPNTHGLPLIDPLRLVYQANDGDNAWNYEVAIPWSAIAPKGSNSETIQEYLAEGVVHGFDISFGDADVIAGIHMIRDRQAAWDIEPGYSDIAWMNRTCFGVVTLEPSASPPPPAQSSWLPPVKTMVIPCATSQVTLDGISDEGFYSDEQSTILFEPRFDTGSTGSDDLAAVFRVCYDYNFLYVQANIADDVEEGPGNSGYDPWLTTNPNESWMYDNSEIYFDLDTNGTTTTAYDSTTAQLRINVGRETFLTASNVGAHKLPIEDPLRALLNTYTNEYPGWVYEVAIPWSAIAPKGSDSARIRNYLAGGTVHGFDISFSDADKITGVHIARDRQAYWDVEPGYGNSSWNNRTQFGVVTLAEGCPATPPPAPLPPSPPLPPPTATSWLSPVRYMNIPFASGPVVLDGFGNEEYYSDEQLTYIFDPLVDAGSFGDADLTAVFKVCYDNTNLYVQANITDGVEDGVGNSSYDPWTSEDPGLSWQYDNSEIFFDLDTNGVSPTAYDSTCVQLRLNRSRDSIMTASANTHELPLIDSSRLFFQANDGTDAWFYEAAIPWTAVAPKGSDADDIAAYLSAGMLHGFDITFGDADIIADVHTSRNRQAAWDIDPGYVNFAWNNRTHFGVVCLGYQCLPTPPTPPPPPPPNANNYITSATLTLYPNPTTGLVTFKNIEAESTVRIMNLAGQVLHSTKLNNNTLDISQFENGIYFIAIGAYVVKLIKQ